MDPTRDVFSIPPPSSDELAALFRRGARRTRIIGLIAGGVTAGLGALMLVLLLFELDPDVRTWSLTMKLLAGAMGAGFGGLGLVFIGTALFSKKMGGMGLCQILLNNPGAIVSARRSVSTGKRVIDPGREQHPGAHSLIAVDQANNTYNTMMSATDVSAALRYIQEHCPDAEVQGL